MNYLTSLLISTGLGFLGVNAIRSRGRMDPLGTLIASVGLGMALSAHIVFYSLFVLGQFSAAAAWTGHGLLLIILLLINYRIYKDDLVKARPPLPDDTITGVGLVILSLLLIPLWREAHFFPFGGWDAWASWNLKAKFIFLGGEDWKNMLDPAMWRSNNQYPFLLPLINVWGWCVAQKPVFTIPLYNTILFSFLTVCAMFWANYRLAQSWTSLLSPLVLFSIPFINTLSISQYSDIVLAFYLLSCVTTMVLARKENNLALAIVSGLYCGLMSFIKTEGALAGMICIGLIVAYLLQGKKESKQLIPPFITAAAFSALPTILFSFLWATKNVSFINGLASADHPADWIRLKTIFLIYAAELITVKWNGLWFLLGCGLFLGWRKCVKSGMTIIPVFLAIYLAGVTFVYWVNTHYEIGWWMTTTLNRILYTLLPLITWWIFASVTHPEDKK